MAKTLSQILSEISTKILTGGRRTTATNTRSVLNDIADSSLNIKDGGLVIETLTGYATNLTPTDDKHLATKKYVDDQSVPDATTTIKGKSELISDAELDSATPSDNSATTPTESAITLGIRQVYRLWKQIFKYFTDRTSSQIVMFADNGGSGNSFTCTNSNPFTGAFPYKIIFSFSSVSGYVPTGASTVTIDSLGTKDLTRQDGTALQSGDVAGGKRYIGLYENSRYSLVGVGISTDGVGSFDANTDQIGATITPVNTPIIANMTVNDAFEATQGQINAKQSTSEKDANSGYVGRDSSGGLSIVDATVTSATASTPVYFSSAKKLITLTSQLWGTFVQTFTSKSTPIDVDTITIFDNSDTFNAKKTTLTQFWTNYLKSKTDAQYWIQGGNTLSAETIFGGTSGAFGLDIRTNNLTALKILSSPASATNYLTIQSTTTANPAILGADGSTNVGLIIQAKGAESIYLNNTGAGGTLKLKWFDSSGSTYRDVITEIGTSNAVGIGTGFTTVNTASTLILGNTSTLRSNNNTLKILAGASTTTASGINIGLNTNNIGPFVPTTGSHHFLNFWNETNNSFQPTTGNANLWFLNFSAFTINQTGSASGSIYGINWNPAITANTGIVAFLRSGMAAGTNNYFLYNDGGAKSYINGNVSVKTNTATAFLTIGACTSSSASLRIQNGSMPTSTAIQDGNLNYDGSNLRFTVSTTDYVLAKTLTASATLDFPSISANSYQDLNITVTGAAVGDIVSLGVDAAAIGANIYFPTPWVSAADTVTIRAVNNDISSSYNPASATFKVSVQKI